MADSRAELDRPLDQLVDRGGVEPAERVELIFLSIGAVFAVIIAWFAILFTGRYPRGLFDYVVGVSRWWTRVFGYAIILVTDEYPPFRLSP